MKLGGCRTPAAEAATSRATRGLDDTMNARNEPHAHHGGIGAQDTVTILEAGTATAAAAVSMVATGWRPPSLEQAGTLGRSAEDGQESQFQPTTQRTIVTEAVDTEIGKGVSMRVFLQPT